MIGELLGWYLAPWRRMNRAEFGLWIGVLSIPGIILMVCGFVSDASGWLAPVMGLMDIGNHLQQGGGDLNATLQQLQQAEGQMEKVAAVPAHGIEWGSLLNNIIQLIMIPLCRMRLRDMGKVWPWELVWALLLNLTAAYGLVAVFGGGDWPGSTIFSLLSFVGYIWLCVKASAPRVAPHEHIPGRHNP